MKYFYTILFAFLLTTSHGQQFTLFHDVFSGPPSSEVLKPKKVGNYLYYCALEDDLNDALWVTDGVEKIKLLVWEIFPVHGAGLTFLYDFNGINYFTIDDGFTVKFFASDGTAAGTEIISANISGFGYATNFLHHNNEVYFIATANNLALWKTNGTISGTEEIKNLCSSNNFDCFEQPLKTAFDLENGQFIFFASTPLTGQEPWVTNGTTEGTTVLEVVPGSEGSSFVPYMDGGVLNHKLYFPAHTNSVGQELFVTDGTTTGTQLVKNINTTTGNEYYNVHSRPNSFFSDGISKVYFFADNGLQGDELWITDGTNNGTQMLIETQPGITQRGDVPSYYFFNGKTYFQLSTGNEVGNYNLYSSDGTASGTNVVKEFNSFLEVFGRNKFEYNNQLYFVCNVNFNQEFWFTDGTTAGTQMLKEINPGNASGIPFHNYNSYPVINSKFYFTADNGLDQGLWNSDGTTLGTSEIALNNAIISGEANTDYLVELNNYLYFVANYNESGNELWRYETLPINTTEESTFPKTFSIYPNPVSEILSIDCTSLYTDAFDLVICDEMGNVVYQNKYNHMDRNSKVLVSTMGMESGLYFLKINSGDKIFTEKLVVLQ
jgi:ELWxxDGT repeat protein